MGTRIRTVLWFLMAILISGAIYASLPKPHEPRSMLDSSVRIEVMVAPPIVATGSSRRRRSISQAEPKPRIGSGTVIGHARYLVGTHSVTRSLILTAKHGVEGATNITVYRSNKQSMPGKVVALSQDSDLALVEVEAHLPKSKLYFGQVVLGEKEWAVGFPLGYGPEINEGYMSDREHASGTQLLQASSAAYPGSSGGGLYVYRHGYVLAGVTQSIARNSVSGIQFLAPNVALFVPMDVVKKFLIEAHVME